MAKYLVRVSYTSEGAKGLIKDGGTKRKAVVDSVVGGLGGSVESFYYALGEDDAFLIVELPDDEAVAAVSMAVGASGAVNLTSTVLLTPEQIDEAAGRTVSYTPPGG